MLPNATEELQSSVRAVARYEAAVRILIRCWSENLSQGKLTGMAFPRVGVRSTAFRASLPGHATELSPKLFQGAEILAVKGDVVPFFAEGSSGPFDLGNFRGTGGEAAVTTPCQPLGMARVEVLTLDGEVTAVAKRPGEYFAEWRAELELARAPARGGRPRRLDNGSGFASAGAHQVISSEAEAPASGLGEARAANENLDARESRPTGPSDQTGQVRRYGELGRASARSSLARAFNRELTSPTNGSPARPGRAPPEAGRGTAGSAAASSRRATSASSEAGPTTLARPSARTHHSSSQSFS